MATLVVIGLGYSATRIVQEVAGRFERIVVTVRDPARAAALTGDQVVATPFDGTAASDRLAAALRDAVALLISAPPRADGADPLLACHSKDLDAASRLAWVGYLSTVGVYGDAGGGWVDETTPCRPVSPRSAARLGVEGAWAEFGAARGVPVVMMRLSGIYGPGQNALEQVRSGTAKRIVKPGQVFNRIHVDDIAGAVAASLARPNVTGPLNVTDDEPAPPQDVTAFAADLLGVPPPPEQDWEAAWPTLSPMARSFWGESKRVRNARLRQDLGYQLRYPTYREGLRALLAHGYLP
ncbi:SDR family oxidoreductase [Blastochloris tepida]|uniref:NAD(P)-dependent oxidoreductase n=1 Tax=Blastochloris tepida TaxID=2233851 RepID=A0A348G4R1_9HYPH|nr:SDR family oxidoreductase [Blastochloris tepida]BBF94544.1 NAD(P)-dependent oxidoreductase [Blastochloris tepida]